jgi:hypothetical protein
MKQNGWLEQYLLELDIQLKIEQKHGTSLDKLVYPRHDSKQYSVCPSQLFIFDIASVRAGTSQLLFLQSEWMSRLGPLGAELTARGYRKCSNIVDRFRYLPLHPTVNGIHGLLHKKQRVGVWKDFDPLLKPWLRDSLMSSRRPCWEVRIWRLAHDLCETP